MATPQDPAVSGSAPAPETSSKGLAANKIGVLSGAILGISTVAPGYTLTASIGLIVGSVALKLPAIFIAGFIPMFLTAYAYRELNSDTTDSGASFTWSTRAFGPYAGWMCGWGMVIATIIVLSNLAAVAVQFLYLTLARIFDHESWADLGTSNKVVNIGTTVVLLALATYVSMRGVTTSERIQYYLVGFQMIVLLVFATVALVKVATGDVPDGGGLAFDIDWFNPFTGMTISAFAVGLTGSIFAFWGWDTCLTLGEECKDKERTPGRAGLLCVLTILGTYLLVGLATMMYAGVGKTGLGLGNEEIEDNVFGALAEPIMGSFGQIFLFLAILASAVASLQTTFLPVARTMLSMGSYKAFPEKFAEISPRYLSPAFGALVAGIVTAVFYSGVTLLSDRTLTDTIAALGIMICWYYGITAFACVWYFRHQLFTSRHNFLYKFLCPLLGGTALILVFGISVKESLDPENGSGASLFGIGLIFYIGFGLLILGAILMVVMRILRPAFFIGETLRRTTPNAPVDIEK
ncbi:MAG: APC family permease [Gordonia sp.]|uniref:APC family permease n=1 Tax=Gordonia sp. (in: high G+C Gram-positive bacteria) TaxID=84139 RepID=UPI001DC85D9A|nr:APC family permease [Gordonia sp. (in: high G+C Gram-positive bacteria)]MCB1294192.1 APC family permease [Gordonia sp. (in: high G+C Gram-positive bacteria)]HQV18605.1 APC family permease [Gordonia sp. (in: high G+C Gram-positive bacteria)]